MAYNPENWYWIVGGDETKLWSSAEADFVTPQEPTYATWSTNGNRASRILSLGELYDVLVQQAPVAALRAAPAMLEANALTPADTYAAKIVTGVQIVSAATSALNAVYPITDNAQSKMQAIVIGIAANKGLPGGGTTFNWLDISGQPHAFTADQFMAFSTAIETYVYELVMAEVALVGGHEAAWPDQPVSIP